MAFTLDNFVRSTLSAAAGATDVTLALAKAAAPLRDPPAASAGAPGVLVLQDAPQSPAKIEVVRYTGMSIAGNVVTLTGVTRGQEGTTAQAWVLGTPTFAGLTAGVIADLQTQVTGKEPAIAASTTSQYWRGDKTWRDFATDVRAAVLTGLSTATNAAITTADTVLSALGKLQAQLSGKANLAGAAFTGPVSATNLSGINTGDQTNVTGNAGTATKLATARTIALGGLLGGSASFDGSGNVTIAATMADGALSVAKTSGLQGALDARAVLAGDNAFGGNNAFTLPVTFRTPNDANANVALIVGANDQNKQIALIVANGILRWDFSGNIWYGSGSMAWSFGGIDKMTLNKNGALSIGSIAASGPISGSNLSGTNTGDQTSVSGNAGTATKLQTPRTISGVAFDGSANITIPYSGLSGLPTLGTAAAQNTTAFATAAQGTKADSAVQPNTAVALTSVTLGGGKLLSKITLGTAVPATLADGELYLQY